MYKSCLETNKKILKIFKKKDIITDEYYQIEETKDGGHTFRYNNGDKKIYINSKYNVSNEVDILLSNIDFSKDSLFIVYGIGLGYHIKELIKRSSPRSKIFVIESDMKILNTYLRNESLVDICSNDKIFLFFGDEQKIIADINSNIFNFTIMPLSVNCVPIIMLSYYQIYGEWIKNINKRIVDLFQYKLFNLGDDIEDTIIGLKNNFKNIKELIKSPSIEIVKNKYTDMPAIIVSAGPSLDKNIEDLKSANGKALVLATDAVISTLIKHNVVPDAVFSIERGIETYEAFYKNNVVDKETVFVGPPVVTKEILEKLKPNKKLLCLKEGEEINEWINHDILKENRTLFMGTSCAHVAFAFAKYVNADPIIFIGQDLAYTKDGITHSEGVEVKEKVNSNNPDLLYVRGIDGEMLPTSCAFKNFLVFLEAEIAKDNSSRFYIDATEGGAFKHGTKIMKLRDAISNYCNKDVPRLNLLVSNSNELDIDKYNKAVCELENLSRKFNNIKVDCKNKLNDLSKLEKKLFDNKITLKEVFKKLRKQENFKSVLLDNGVVRTFLQSLIMMSDIKKTTLGNKETYEIAVEKIKIYKKLMNDIIVGCSATYNSINGILNEMYDDNRLLNRISKMEI